MTRKVVIAGGGTAGHVVAGLAFANAYRKRGAKVTFIGSGRGFEKELVPRNGFEISLISASAFGRQTLRGRAAALCNAVRGTWEARRILLRDRPDVVISVGGFPSVGPSLAARSLGIPLVIHEANAIPGLANRLASRLASRICVGFAGTGFAGAIRTGNPVSAGIVKHQDGSGPTRFLVMGGSEGSPFLNRSAPALLAAVQARSVDLTVRHLAGSGDVAGIEAEYKRLGVAASVTGFVEGMELVYASADVAVSCAGALTLAELAHAGVPALLVPLSTATNSHQSANARVFADQTGCRWTSEAHFDAERESEWLASVAGDANACRKIKERLEVFAKEDASEALVDVCEKLLR